MHFISTVSKLKDVASERVCQSFSGRSRTRMNAEPRRARAHCDGLAAGEVPAEGHGLVDVEAA
jgi:hypothetical protein